MTDMPIYMPCRCCWMIYFFYVHNVWTMRL